MVDIAHTPNIADPQRHSIGPARHERLHEWLRFEVTDDDRGRKLGAVLRCRFQVSRGALRRLKAENGALLNGEPARLDAVLAVGDSVVLMADESPSRGVAPENIPLDVVFEDGHLLVVNKPAGMVVHPARRHVTGTLAAAVAFHLAEQGYPGPVRPVNRLDRETSGLIVFAKSAYIHERLARHLNREYACLARGCVTENEGAIAAPIVRVEGDSMRRTVAVEGDAVPAAEAALGLDARDAVTHFRVLCRWPRVGASLVLLRLETGRTHQIRVHLAHEGHPLFGDSLYSPPVAAAVVMSRTALHARRLDLEHPVSKRPLSFSAPLPADFLQGLAALNRLEHSVLHNDSASETG